MRGGLDGIDGMDVYETRQRGEGVRGITEDRCVSDSVASIRRERYAHIPFTQPTAHSGYTVHCQPYEEAFFSVPSIAIKGSRVLNLPANKEFAGSRGLDNNFPQYDLRVGVQCV